MCKNPGVELESGVLRRSRRPRGKRKKQVDVEMEETAQALEKTDAGSVEPGDGSRALAHRVFVAAAAAAAGRSQQHLAAEARTPAATRDEVAELATSFTAGDQVRVMACAHRGAVCTVLGTGPLRARLRLGLGKKVVFVELADLELQWLKDPAS